MRLYKQILAVALAGIFAGALAGAVAIPEDPMTGAGLGAVFGMSAAVLVGLVTIR